MLELDCQPVIFCFKIEILTWLVSVQNAINSILGLKQTIRCYDNDGVQFCMWLKLIIVSCITVVVLSQVNVYNWVLFMISHGCKRSTLFNSNLFQSFSCMIFTCVLFLCQCVTLLVIQNLVYCVCVYVCVLRPLFSSYVNCSPNGLLNTYYYCCCFHFFVQHCCCVSCWQTYASPTIVFTVYHFCFTCHKLLNLYTCTYFI